MKKQLSRQITLGIDPYSGKRIRKRIYAATKAGLDQVEKDAIREFTKHGAPSNMTFIDYKDKWFAAYCSQLQPVTQEHYKYALKKCSCMNYKKMHDITRSDLQAIINEDWNHPSTCRRLAGLLNAIWRSAVLDGVVDKNIAENLKRPKSHSEARRALTEKELEAIGTAPFTELERFMVDVLLQFGLRPGEAFALGRTSFNKKDRTLTINKAVAYNVAHPFVKQTKTGVTRVLPVPDSFWSKIPKTDKMYFFVNKDGSLFDKNQKRDFSRAIINKINVQMGGTDQLKLTNMTLYYFRHNKASLLYYMPGISLKKKAEYLGHSEQMFLRTYSHLMNEKEDTEILRQAVM